MTVTAGRHAPALAALVLSASLAACGGGEATGGDDTSTGTAAAAPEPTGTTADPDTDGATVAPAPSTSDDDEDGASQTMERPQPLPAPTGPVGTAALPLGDVPDSVVQRDDVQEAIAAEAERSGVARAAVRVAGWAEVTWSDGSIGCPEPGQVYTQALVPGYQLVLEVDGDYRSYHAGDRGGFRYCAQPMVPSEGARSDS